MTPICACRKPKPTEVVLEESAGPPDAWRLIVRYLVCDKCGLNCLLHPEGGS